MKVAMGNEEIKKALEGAGATPGASKLQQDLAKAAILAKQGGGAGVVAKQIKNAMISAQKAGVLKDSNSLNKQMVKILGQQLTAMGQAEGTRIHMLRMSQVQAQLAQAQNKINRQAAAGGGIKAFMDPAALDKQEDTFNDSLKRFQKAGARGDVVTRGRASGELLSNLSQFMGGTQNAPWAEGLKDVLEQGLATDLKSRALARADVLEGAGKATGDQKLIQAAGALRGMDFNEIAKTQVALEHKRKNVPVNIAKLVNWQNTLAQLQQRDLAANSATAANTAKMANELVPGFVAGMRGLAASGAFGATVGGGGAAGMGAMGTRAITAQQVKDKAQFGKDLERRETVAADINKLIMSGKSDPESIKKLHDLVAQLKTMDTRIMKYTNSNKSYADEIRHSRRRGGALIRKKARGETLTATEETELEGHKKKVRSYEMHQRRGQMAAMDYGRGQRGGLANAVTGQVLGGYSRGTAYAEQNLTLDPSSTVLNNQEMYTSALLANRFGQTATAYGGTQHKGGDFQALGGGIDAQAHTDSRASAMRNEIGKIVSLQISSVRGDRGSQAYSASAVRGAYRKRKTGGRYSSYGTAQADMIKAINANMQDLQRKYQSVRAVGTSQGDNQGKVTNELAKLITRMEINERAMEKVRRGELIGGQASDLGGIESRKKIAQNLGNVMLQPTIVVKIPAEVSLSGRAEVFKLRQQVQALQAQVGTPASNTGGGMHMGGVAP
jgi:hypothetical protein